MTTVPTSHHETSGYRADTHPVLANPGDTAEAVRQQVRVKGRSDWELVCVIGDDGRLLGTLTAPELLVLPADKAVGGALRPDGPRVHVEDLHRLAGIKSEQGEARNALEEPPLRRVRHRLPWLVVGRVGSMVATFVVARFESTLTAKPELAFFIPGWCIWPTRSAPRAKRWRCGASRSAMSGSAA